MISAAELAGAPAVPLHARIAEAIRRDVFAPHQCPRWGGKIATAVVRGKFTEADEWAAGHPLDCLIAERAQLDSRRTSCAVHFDQFGRFKHDHLARWARALYVAFPAAVKRGDVRAAKRMHRATEWAPDVWAQAEDFGHGF